MVNFYLLRNGVVRKDKELYFFASPTITMREETEIHCRLQGEFLPMKEMNCLQDHILCQVNGEDCGEFVATHCQSVRKGGLEYWRMEACDQSCLLARQHLEQPLEAAKGQNYMELIQALLKQVGIWRIQAEPSSECFPCHRQWERGYNLLSLVNELLQEIGFDSLFFDGSGRACLRAYRGLSKEAVTAVYRYGDAVLEDGFSETQELFAVQNVFHAVADSPDRKECWLATAVNEDPNNPFSTVNLGRIMAPLLLVENVASQEALQVLVNRKRDESMLASRELQFRTALVVHGVGEWVAVEHPQLDGIFRESGWCMNLGEETMTHTGKRVCASL